jgi:hypothetical protein
MLQHCPKGVQKKLKFIAIYFFYILAWNHKLLISYFINYLFIYIFVYPASYNIGYTCQPEYQPQLGQEAAMLHCGINARLSWHRKPAYNLSSHW